MIEQVELIETVMTRALDHDDVRAGAGAARHPRATRAPPTSAAAAPQADNSNKKARAGRRMTRR
jgi:hypothetical protein